MCRSAVIPNEQSRFTQGRSELTQAAAFQPANRKAGSILDGVKDSAFIRATRKDWLKAHFSLQVGGQLGKLLRRPLLSCKERGGVHHDVFLARRHPQAGAPLLPPRPVLGAHEDSGAGDFLWGQAEVEERASLMFGGVQDGLVQDEAGIRDQDLVVLRRAKVLKADFSAGSAQPRQEPAGRASVQVKANRKLFPAERQRRAQTRGGFDETFTRGEDLVDVRVALQKVSKARLDEHAGNQVGPPGFKQMEGRCKENYVANRAKADEQNSRSFGEAGEEGIRCHDF
jgi:hypothetical protein